MRQETAKTKRKKVHDSWEDEDSDAGEAATDVADDEQPDTPASWDEDDGAGLAKVYKAFRLLQNEFEEKFKKVSA